MNIKPEENSALGKFRNWLYSCVVLVLGLPSPCQQGDGLLAEERRLGNGAGSS